MVIFKNDIYSPQEEQKVLAKPQTKILYFHNITSTSVVTSFGTPPPASTSCSVGASMKTNTLHHQNSHIRAHTVLHFTFNLIPAIPQFAVCDFLTAFTYCQ